MNLRRLKYFVRIVDVGSLTQASEVLHIAQPALSQQLATLESEFGQQLLLRTQKGVEATAAGRVLYAHAQTILRQFEQAREDVQNAGLQLAGQVSVGLATGTAASALALPLLREVHERHPGIVLRISENLGTAFCDVVRCGHMDMAVFYSADRAMQGLSFEPILNEEMFVVAPASLLDGRDEVALVDLQTVDLLLPRPGNPLRKRLDQAFASARVVPRVVTEVESSTMLSAAVGSGLGATILPASAARGVAAEARARLLRIVSPCIEMPLALCGSDHLPMSESAQAVKAILLEMAHGLPVAPLRETRLAAEPVGV